MKASFLRGSVYNASQCRYICSALTIAFAISLNIDKWSRSRRPSMSSTSGRLNHRPQTQRRRDIQTCRQTYIQTDIETKHCVDVDYINVLTAVVLPCYIPAIHVFSNNSSYSRRQCCVVPGGHGPCGCTSTMHHDDSCGRCWLA